MASLPGPLLEPIDSRQVNPNRLRTIPIPNQLPRKFRHWDQASQSERLAKVKPECVDLWRRGMERGRNDTFIGVVELDTMTLFIAPCFGVWAEDVPTPENASPLKTEEHLANVTSGRFDSQKLVFGGSTSSAEEKYTSVRKAELDAVYGPGNVCYAWLKDKNKGFDGYSHQAMRRWVRDKNWHSGVIINGEDWWYRALGFAIQRDRRGYYIRFASTLNSRRGQNPNSGQAMFEPRPVKSVPVKHRFTVATLCSCQLKPIMKMESHEDREKRDLPEQWALFVEETLARDLKLRPHKPNGDKYERMISANSHKLSKMRRFDERVLV